MVSASDGAAVSSRLTPATKRLSTRVSLREIPLTITSNKTSNPTAE
ncbi:MAG: hypothetical protein NTV46_12735 [Verrucomicrobia bacterium]|nr:hypothetical protein [Verrucomicrobiota bacterium]